MIYNSSVKPEIYKEGRKYLNCEKNPSFSIFTFNKIGGSYKKKGKTLKFQQHLNSKRCHLFSTELNCFIQLTDFVYLISYFLIEFTYLISVLSVTREMCKFQTNKLLG